MSGLRTSSGRDTPGVARTAFRAQGTTRIETRAVESVMALGSCEVPGLARAEGSFKERNHCEGHANQSRSN